MKFIFTFYKYSYFGIKYATDYDSLKLPEPKQKVIIENFGLLDKD